LHVIHDQRGCLAAEHIEAAIGQLDPEIYVTE
jgi:hypothetical protein